LAKRGMGVSCLYVLSKVACKDRFFLHTRNVGKKGSRKAEGYPDTKVTWMRARTDRSGWLEIAISSY
jgi:hypothetical protein